MIDVAVLIFNSFRENTYVVSDESGECVIIDAGNYSADEDRAIAQYVENKGLKPVLALNTHGHVDHILGVQYVKDTFGIPFAIHGDDAFLLDAAQQHGTMYGFDVKTTPVAERDLKGQSGVKFGNTTLQIIHTPGHSPGHVCFYEPQSRALFSGDTLFRESIGRTDLPGGDYSWIMRSILENIVPLGGDVRFYPGHGAESTIGHEMMYNPFIVEVLNDEVSYKS